MRYINILLTILLLPLLCLGQNNSSTGPAAILMYPVKSVSVSPQAASLGLYQDNNSDYFTGKTSIDIPIYTIEHAGYNLPISISYTTGGFRVNEVASFVGLGWNLNAGGLISREVKGVPDEIFHNGYQYEAGDKAQALAEYAYGPDHQLPLNNADAFVDLLDVSTGHLDGEPDIYNVHVGDISFKFLFDKDDNIHFLGEHKKIFDVSHTHQIDPNNSSYNSINEFVITDDRGIKYYFGSQYIERLENTYTYSGSNTEHAFSIMNFPTYEEIRYYGIGPTIRAWDNENIYYNISWYIYKIEFPEDSQCISFNYQEELNTLYSSTSERKYVGQWANKITQSPVNVDPDYPFVIQLIHSYIESKSQRLTRITYRDVNIEFIADEGVRNDINDPIRSGPTGNAKALNRIIISDNKGSQKIWQLKKSYFRDNYTGQYSTFKKRLKLDTIVSGDQKWIFEYNTTLTLPSRNSTCIDYWGYYKYFSTEPRFSIPKLYTYPGDYNNQLYHTIYSIYPRSQYMGSQYLLAGIDRTPSLESTKACVLNKVTFPTKGYKRFNYELNTFYLDGQERVGPGLRVSSIVSNFGGEEITETYTYNNGSITSGLITELPDFAYQNVDAIVNNNHYSWLFNTSLNTPELQKDAITNRVNYSYCSLGQIKGGYVGYTNVKTSVSGQGSTEYKFEFGPSFTNPVQEPFTRPTTPIESAWNDEGFIGPSFYFINSANLDKYPYLSNPSLDWGSGYLTDIIYRNNDQQTIKSIHKTYQRVENANEQPVYYIQGGMYNQDVHTMIVYFGSLGLPWEPGCDFSATLNCIFLPVSMNDIIWGANYYKSGYKRLVGETTTTFDVAGNNPVIQTTDYKYNTAHNYVNHLERADSKGNLVKEYFYYPEDYDPSEPYISPLMSNHLLNKLIDNRTYVNTQMTLGNQYKYNSRGQLTDIYDYESTNNIAHQWGSPYSFTHKESMRYDLSTKTLKETQKDYDINTTYIWGYNYAFPIAVIQNETFSNVIAQIGSYSDLQNKSDEQLRTIFMNLRTSMPNAFITSYTFKPLLGKTSETDINGKTTYYEYDSNLRLITIKDQDGKVIKHIDYNYQSE